MQERTCFFQCWYVSFHGSPKAMGWGNVSLLWFIVLFHIVIDFFFSGSFQIFLILFLACSWYLVDMLLLTILLYSFCLRSCYFLILLIFLSISVELLIHIYIYKYACNINETKGHKFETRHRKRRRLFIHIVILKTKEIMKLWATVETSIITTTIATHLSLSS